MNGSDDMGRLRSEVSRLLLVYCALMLIFYMGSWLVFRGEPDVFLIVAFFLPGGRYPYSGLLPDFVNTPLRLWLYLRAIDLIHWGPRFLCLLAWGYNQWLPRGARYARLYALFDIVQLSLFWFGIVFMLYGDPPMFFSFLFLNWKETLLALGFLSAPMIFLCLIWRIHAKARALSRLQAAVPGGGAWLAGAVWTVAYVLLCAFGFGLLLRLLWRLRVLL